MDGAMKFDYYYGAEAEQLSFGRVPAFLIRDERFGKLSNDAKLLYMMMLDRVALSAKNGWIDMENRAYVIYAVDDVMKDLGHSRATCIKALKELDGIGLIEKKRRGLGMTNIIYVKNFEADFDKNPDRTNGCANVSTEAKRNCTPSSLEDELYEVQGAYPNYINPNNTNPNYINYNKTNYSYTNCNQDNISNINNINHINQSNISILSQIGKFKFRTTCQDMGDGIHQGRTRRDRAALYAPYWA